MEYLRNYFSIDLLLTGILGYLIVAAKNLPSIIYNFIVKRFSVSIYASSVDYRSYNTVLEWLESLNNDYLNNNIRLDSIWNVDKDGKDYIKNKFNLNYGSYLIKLDTFTFATISKTVINNNQNVSSGDQMNSINVRIFGKNKYKYKKNIIDNSMKLEEKKYITVASHPHVCDRSFRSFDTIIMNNDIKRRIINYIDTWLNNKDIYLKNNVPYKTGILLYGEPGTGKSSLARAIASYLKYDIDIININNLNACLNPLRTRTVILIEDIDCMFTSREYQDENSKDYQLNKSQLGEMLNFIDGQMSPENCIFIATTNHIERLDPALIRPGRFDLQIEMKYLDYELASQMCERFNQNPDDILKDEKLPISPAYLQAKLIENLYK